MGIDFDFNIYKTYSFIRPIWSDFGLGLIRGFLLYLKRLQSPGAKLRIFSKNENKTSQNKNKQTNREKKN